MTIHGSTNSRIEDYALIGDTHTAALVSRNGSIDWLCFPRFDSAACFAALLGEPVHGRWLIAPDVEDGSTVEVRRRYVGDTLVLETEFLLPGGGCAAIIDFMPVRNEAAGLIRIVEGRGVTVPMRMEYIVRFDYGSVIPWLRRMDSFEQNHQAAPSWCRAVVSAVAGPDSLCLRSGVPVENRNYRTFARFQVTDGERIPFTLTWHASHLTPPPPLDPEDNLAGALRRWQEWIRSCNYRGEWRDAVVRSLITLKALIYAPTGGVVAAATTSLPEKLGGVRNWDYRHCWLRDATLTFHSLLRCGCVDEARAWHTWLLRAVAGSPAETQIMYGLAGERRLTELELDWLPGYENSRPVRIGNAAWKQLQLDVYGEVLNTSYYARKTHVELDNESWQLDRALLGFLEEAWIQPDEGLWEMRGPRRHFTHSKVMAWVAFDRGVKSIEQFGMEGPLSKWREIRERIHAQVCHEGFNQRINSFVQSYGSKNLDASLLMIPIVGFLPAADPRVCGTVEAIERRLMRDGFVMRYDTEDSNDGLPPGEGVFLATSFWLADNLHLMNRHEEARALFERLLAVRNDVGLFSEEYDTATGRLVGNFPQAFSHLGLLTTALNLAPEE